MMNDRQTHCTSITARIEAISTQARQGELRENWKNDVVRARWIDLDRVARRWSRDDQRAPVIARAFNVGWVNGPPFTHH
jgi:hypothetical protein